MFDKPVALQPLLQPLVDEPLLAASAAVMMQLHFPDALPCQLL
jgi:hypothetical protein